MNQIRSKVRCAVVLLMAVCFVGAGFQAESAAKGPEVRMVPETFSKLALEVRSGVVNIRTVKTLKDGGRVFRHFFGNPFGGGEGLPDPFSGKNPGHDFKQQSLGSGFIIDTQGYIVTNNHVVENAEQIKVKLSNGNEFDATVVGRDPKTDLALIKITPTEDLVPLEMGDSDALEVGSWVVAIGSPFGLEQTVTAGIVSAKGRVIGAGPYDDFIQTDASINPGNSGGPLLNTRGEVVGINTAIIASGQGIGFAIPVNMARGIVDQLKQSGEVTRGWLGVGIQDLSAELAAYYNKDDSKGVLVTEVHKGDPADKGGIRVKDIITGVNGDPVDSARSLSRIIANSPVGREIPITVFRGGKEKTLAVVLAKRTDSNLTADRKTESTDDFGLKLAELTPETSLRLGLPDHEKGVLITDVEPGSKGEKAGVRRGDIVKEVNRAPIDTLTDYRRQLEQARTGTPVHLLLKRPHAGFVAVKIV